jgi:hypothetical protein
MYPKKILETSCALLVLSRSTSAQLSERVGCIVLVAEIMNKIK